MTNRHNIERSISSTPQTCGAARKPQVRAPPMNMVVTQKLCRESGYDRNKHVNGLVKRWVFCLYMKTYGHPRKCLFHYLGASPEKSLDAKLLVSGGTVG